MANMQFEDILQDRRDEASNLLWVSRKLSLLEPYRQNLPIDSVLQKFEVLSSQKVKDILQKISERFDVPKDVLVVQISNILNEIGYNKSIPTLRILGFALTKICLRVCQGIFVNRSTIENLKLQLGNNPVIYVPSHRSYADFILMSYVLFTQNIEIPAIAAGMDFHGMMGMGKVLRDTGAFFMRRSYNDDALYWDLFKLYVHQLITRGSIGIEFFIEGTRSRSCKSLPPKFGLLSMILKAYLTGEVPDILIVPINISYDRILEERLFAFELLGVPKPKETTSGFIKSLKLVRENYGKIHVNFGEAISVRNYFSNGKLNRAIHATKPLHLQEVTNAERSLISNLAESIVTLQQKLSVVTTFNVIALVINNHMLTEQKICALSLESLLNDVVWVNSVLSSLGANVVKIDSGNIKEEVINALNVHKGVVRVANGQVSLVSEVVNLDLDSIDVAKMKGHVFSSQTMTKAIPVILLQIYVNPILHYVIDMAVVVVVLLKEPINEAILLEEFIDLRGLLSKEFVFSSTDIIKNYEMAIELMKKLNIITINSGKIVLEKHNRLTTLLFNIIESVLFSYNVMCTILLEFATKPCLEKHILINCQAKLERLINGNGFIHPYCLNLDSLTHCLHSLLQLGCINKIINNKMTHYEVDYLKVQEVLCKIDSNRQSKHSNIVVKHKL